MASRLNWSLRHLLDLVSFPSVWRFKEACEAFAASNLVSNTQMLCIDTFVMVEPLASYVAEESVFASFFFICKWWSKDGLSFVGLS